jgi:hypothetical protein
MSHPLQTSLTGAKQNEVMRFGLVPSNMSFPARESRRDDTLLTACFSWRSERILHPSPSLFRRSATEKGRVVGGSFPYTRLKSCVNEKWQPMASAATIDTISFFVTNSTKPTKTNFVHFRGSQKKNLSNQHK